MGGDETAKNNWEKSEDIISFDAKRKFEKSRRSTKLFCTSV